MMNWSLHLVTPCDRHLKTKWTASWMTVETRLEEVLRRVCQNLTTSKLWWFQALRDQKLTSHRSVSVHVMSAAIKAVTFSFIQVKLSYSHFWLSTVFVTLTFQFVVHGYYFWGDCSRQSRLEIMFFVYNQVLFSSSACLSLLYQLGQLEYASASIFSTVFF